VQKAVTLFLKINLDDEAKIEEGNLFQRGAVRQIRFCCVADKFEEGRQRRRLWLLVLSGGSKFKKGFRLVLHIPETTE